MRKVSRSLWTASRCIMFRPICTAPRAQPPLSPTALRSKERSTKVLFFLNTPVTAQLCSYAQLHWSLFSMTKSKSQKPQSLGNQPKGPQRACQGYYGFGSDVVVPQQQKLRQLLGGWPSQKSHGLWPPGWYVDVIKPHQRIPAMMILSVLIWSIQICLESIGV